MTSRLILGVALAISLFANPAFSQNKIDEMSLDRWKLLREAERHQLNVAEKYYRERQFKIALGEYDKFVTLYEKSEGGILYGQVTSSAPGAPWALYQIAQVREASGDNEAAIKAYQTVCKKFPKDGHAAQAHAHLLTKYKINVTLGGAAEE